MAALRNGLIAALDIGTTKVCCFVARVDASGGIRVKGIGHQVANGMKSGNIVDMEAVEESIGAAVDAAERMAGDRKVDKVFVNLSAGQPRSHAIEVEVEIAGHEIRPTDVTRALQQARGLAAAEAEGRELVHSLTSGFAIDGTPGYREPRGMFGSRLGVNLHAVSAAPGPVRNLRMVAERCHLDIEKLAVSPYAAGLATLVEDETDLGVTLIDMGGGTTTLAVFYDGYLVHTDTVPVGGLHVTNDIARGLSTPARSAERLKTLYGSAIAGPADDRDMVAVPQIGESGADAIQQLPRSVLIGIIQPRIEETLELVRDRLEASGFARLAGRRAVLTGGACMLTGVRELAARILDKQVRIGRPLRIQGLAEATEGPAFGVCAGLLVYAARGGHLEMPETAPVAADVAQAGRFVRIGRWFKENF
jgi:cell division protein FtsA